MQDFSEPLELCKLAPCENCEQPFPQVFGAPDPWWEGVALDGSLGSPLLTRG